MLTALVAPRPHRTEPYIPAATGSGAHTGLAVLLDPAPRIQCAPVVGPHIQRALAAGLPAPLSSAVRARTVLLPSPSRMEASLPAREWVRDTHVVLSRLGVLLSARRKRGLLLASVTVAVAWTGVEVGAPRVAMEIEAQV